MSNSRTPLKGEPNFTIISNERLKDYIDLTQQMIFAYKECDAEKTRVLTEIWKQMSSKYSERLCELTCAVLDSKDKESISPNTVVHKIKMVKRIKR